MPSAKTKRPKTGLSKHSLRNLVDEIRAREWAIYGADSRREVYQTLPGIHPQAERNVRATVALVDHRTLERVHPSSWKVIGPSLGEAEQLCQGEAFFDQPAPADCSGFLVAPDLVATAGHCAVDHDELRALTRIVFGFELRRAKQQRFEVSADHVYRVVDVLEASLRPDWALVRLDRAVPPEVAIPVRVRQGKPLKRETAVYMVGHPSGLPKKFAADARVFAQRGDLLIADVDAFGGNSGSMIADAGSHEIIGMLVAGSEDYLDDDRRGCRYALRCGVTTRCSGEGITVAATFAAKITPTGKARQRPSAR